MKRTLLAAAAIIAVIANPAMLQKAAAQDVEKGQHAFNNARRATPSAPLQKTKWVRS